MEFKDSDKLGNWLEGKPPEFSVVIASRIALRMVPVLDELFVVTGLGKKPSQLLLPIFRAMALPFVAGKFPVEGKEVADATTYATAYATAHTAAYATAHTAARAAARAADAASAAFVAIDAASAARAAVAAARAAFVASAAFAAVDAADANLLEGGIAPEMVARRPLWPDKNMGGLEEQWRELKKNLLALNEDWEVWTDWYEDILAGRNRAGLPDGLAEELELKIALRDNEWWERGAAAVNKDIKAWTVEALETARGGKEQEEHSSQLRSALASVASPDLRLDENGRLDVGPNPRLDVPVLDAEMRNLPEQQSAVVTAILDALPKNTPPIVGACLLPYGEHLASRGVWPIVGLLQQLYSAVETAYLQEEGALWGEGLAGLFQDFRDNHDQIMRHFPLSKEREELYSQFTLVEGQATNDAIVKPVVEVAEALTAPRGLSTDDVVTLLDATVRNARQIAAMQGAGSAAPKKRFLLSFIGLAERAYNLFGATASIASTPQGTALLTLLASNIDRLLMLVKSAL